MRKLLLVALVPFLVAGCESFTTDEAYDCPSGEYCTADASEGGNLSAYTVRKRGRQAICNRWHDVCPNGYSGNWPQWYNCDRQGPFQVTCRWYTRFSAGNHCPTGSAVYLQVEGIKYVSSQGTRYKQTVVRSGPSDWDCIVPSQVQEMKDFDGLEAL
jgi:hypothetical protein